jgi:hypothetical protein
MSEYYKDQALLQIVIKVDTELSHLTRRLNKAKYLEIGDDPSLVGEIESELSRIMQQIRSVGAHFDLSMVPLSKANYYYTATGYIKDALDYVSEIKARNYGSMQHTNQFLAKLNACVDSIKQIGDLVESPSTRLH